MSKPLAGKVALVTGGSRGLGAATVRLLAEQGADVAFTYVSSDKPAQAVVDELRGKGPRPPLSGPTRRTRAGRHS